MRFSIAFAILVLASAISNCFGSNWTDIDKTPDVTEKKGVEMGDKKIKVNTYKPKEAKDGLIIFIHGGGFVMPHEDTYSSILKYIAKDTKLNIVSIDYKLAKEEQYKYPFQYNECVHVIDFLLGEKNKDFPPKSKVVIMGDSAGGNLAAAMAQKYREKFKLQVLIYPWMQMADYKLPSFQVVSNKKYTAPAWNTYLLTDKEVAKFTLSYLRGQEYGAAKEADLTAIVGGAHLNKDKRDKIAGYLKHEDSPHLNEYKKDAKTYPGVFTYLAESADAKIKAIGNEVIKPEISPLFQKDLANVPTTYMLTVGIDSLRDDGLLYIKRLETARVKVVKKDFPNASHGDIRKPDSPEAKEMLNGIGTFIKQELPVA